MRGISNDAVKLSKIILYAPRFEKKKFNFENKIGLSKPVKMTIYRYVIFFFKREKRSRQN